MIDGIMIYSVVDITLFIRCMLWAMCHMFAERHVVMLLNVVTHFTFVQKKKKKKKKGHHKGPVYAQLLGKKIGKRRMKFSGGRLFGTQ